MFGGGTSVLDERTKFGNYICSEAKAIVRRIFFITTMFGGSVDTIYGTRTRLDQIISFGSFSASPFTPTVRGIIIRYANRPFVLHDRCAIDVHNVRPWPLMRRTRKLSYAETAQKWRRISTMTEKQNESDESALLDNDGRETRRGRIETRFPC